MHTNISKKNLNVMKDIDLQLHDMKPLFMFTEELCLLEEEKKFPKYWEIRRVLNSGTAKVFEMKSWYKDIISAIFCLLNEHCKIIFSDIMVRKIYKISNWGRWLLASNNQRMKNWVVIKFILHFISNIRFHWHITCWFINLSIYTDVSPCVSLSSLKILSLGSSNLCSQFFTTMLKFCKGKLLHLIDLDLTNNESLTPMCIESIISITSGKALISKSI